MSATSAWATRYAGLGAFPVVPDAPRPPRPGYAWTWDGTTHHEVRLMRAVVNVNAIRGKDEETSDGD